MLKKIKTKRIKEVLGQIPSIMGKHSFLLFLMLLGIVLILGGVVFYQYSILPSQKEPSVSQKLLKIDQQQYSKVKEIWESKKKNFELASSKQFPDPFGVSKTKPSPKPPEEEPKKPEPSSSKLQQASTLSEFYEIKGEPLPSVDQRSLMWQKQGLGSPSDYIGSSYQNFQLLQILKQKLTQ